MAQLPLRISTEPNASLAPTYIVAAIRQRRSGGLLNLERILLKSPRCAVCWNQHIRAERAGLSLIAQLRELLIFAMAVWNQADYELSLHAPEFLHCGGRQAPLDALPRDGEQPINIELFSPLEQAALAFGREMTLQVQVSDACFPALKARQPVPQQLVELAGVVAAYKRVSRFLECSARAAGRQLTAARLLL